MPYLQNWQNISFSIIRTESFYNKLMFKLQLNNEIFFLKIQDKDCNFMFSPMNAFMVAISVDWREYIKLFQHTSCDLKVENLYTL